jgi:hypothetical protein
LVHVDPNLPLCLTTLCGGDAPLHTEALARAFLVVKSLKICNFPIFFMKTLRQIIGNHSAIHPQHIIVPTGRTRLFTDGPQYIIDGS